MKPSLLVLFLFLLNCSLRAQDECSASRGGMIFTKADLPAQYQGVLSDYFQQALGRSLPRRRAELTMGIIIDKTGRPCLAYIRGDKVGVPVGEWKDIVSKMKWSPALIQDQPVLFQAGLELVFSPITVKVKVL